MRKPILLRNDETYDEYMSRTIEAQHEYYRQCKEADDDRKYALEEAKFGRFDDDR